DDRQWQVDYVCGCAMLIRRQVIEKIGGLDRRFFVYWEDADYSLRATKSGFGLLQVTSARVLHKVSQRIGGGQSPDAFYYMERNRFLVSARRLGIPSRLALLNKHVRRCFWEYAKLSDEQKSDLALAVAEAGWDCLLSRYGKRRPHSPTLLEP